MSANPLSALADRIASSTTATVGTCAAIVAAVILAAGHWVPSPGLSGAALAQAGPAAAAPATTPIDPKVISAEQRKAIEQIVREYLLGNPEILVELSKELETRQQAQQAVVQRQVIAEKKAAIFRAPTDFVLGNPKGDVTVVEFFDYNCGWCKRAVDEMLKLTKADPNVRVVMKELPIFGENSQAAAKAAMASISQGKYWEFHVALMKERQVTKDNVLKIAEKVGLDVARLKKDMDDPKIEAALKANQEIAQALNIEGTPGFIIDNKVNVGFLPSDGIKDILAEVRKAGCQVC